MSLYGDNFKIKEKIIGVKIPIEVDSDLRRFIFDNINTYRDIKNDFIEAANEHKKKYKTYKGFNAFAFKTKYYKKEVESGIYDERCVGLSEQVSKDIDMNINSILAKYKNAASKEKDKDDDKKTGNEGTFHFRKLNKFYGSFKVHNKAYINKRCSTKRCCSRLHVIDSHTVSFRVRANKGSRVEEIRYITLKEPLYDDAEFKKNGNHSFTRYYTEGASKHECVFNSVNIKETCFIHELGKFYIQFSIKVCYCIDNDEIDSRIKSKAGIDTGIHNPIMIYEGKGRFISLRMEEKAIQRIHYLERRAGRIKHHMDNKLVINKKKVEKGEMENEYSKNYLKLQKKFRKAHKHIRNIRRHWRNVTCKKIVTRYKTIVVDTFTQPVNKYVNLPKKLKKKINHNNRFHAMYLFNETLKHMAEKYGCEYINAPTHTTCTCSKCGYINPHLPLSQRELVCEECGYAIDRDMNASKNCYAFA